MKLERTKNGIRNLIWGVLNRFVGIIFPFLLRTVFIYTLGSNYLGLNSLFTSILTVLNLAELGFSSAIVFNMYKPIANNDTETICALMRYYRMVYHRIGAVVTVLGLLPLPFLRYLINGYCPDDINLVFLYLLFLLNTTISYFLFAYKNCILTAYQREDVISKINIVLKLLMYLFQSVFLLVWKNYYAYVICTILNTICTNIVTAYYSNKYYPTYYPKGELSSGLRSAIKRNIKGLMIGKLCLVSRNSFDNIFLSAFLGLTTVTIYGNYYYIMNSISGVLIIVTSSMGAGIGNSVAMETVEKNYSDFTKFTFMYSWISGWCTVCLLCLYQPFMKIWMGNDLLFPMLDVILLCLYFYSLTMGDVKGQYNSSVGLFWESRYYVLAEALTNVVLNYFLGKIFGVHGIILATWISLFFINFIWGTSVLFKNYFTNFSKYAYYKKQLWYMLVVIFVSSVTYLLTTFIHLGEYQTMFAIAGICIVFPNGLFYIIYHRRPEFLDSKCFVVNNLIPKIFPGRSK